MHEILLSPIPLNDLKQIIFEVVQDSLAKANTIPTQAQKQPTEIGGIDLAVEVTGLKRPTLYALASRREIPFMKRGKRLYFKRTELLQWIQEGRKKTAKEIEAEAATSLIVNGKSANKSQP